MSRALTALFWWLDEVGYRARLSAARVLHGLAYRVQHGTFTRQQRRPVVVTLENGKRVIVKPQEAVELAVRALFVEGIAPHLGPHEVHDYVCAFMAGWAAGREPEPPRRKRTPDRALRVVA